jgi:hypothetical protein
MEGPNGCWPKSSRFLLLGLLGIIKMGPRALHWGPIQISSHPTWWSMWRKFGSKALDLSKENGPITKLGPIWDWALKWVKGLYIERPNCRPICKTGAICWPKYHTKWISTQMGWALNVKSPLVHKGCKLDVLPRKKHWMWSDCQLELRAQWETVISWLLVLCDVSASLCKSILNPFIAKSHCKPRPL